MKPEALEHLLNLSRHMATTHALQPLLDYAMDEAIHFVEAESGYLVLLDPDGKLEFRVVRAKGNAELTGYGDLISTTIVQNVIRSGQPVVTKNAMADPNWKQAKSVAYLRLRSVMCAPLTIHGTCIGAIYVENRSIENLFNESDLLPLILFADHAAVYIENANLYGGLEALVEERTASLQIEIAERQRAEEALRQSLAELEARNKELDAFSHTVAHDLKNPVSLILGTTELLLMDDQPRFSVSETREMLGMVSRTAYKLNDIIDALLLLAGVGKETIAAVPLDMGHIVGEAISRLGYVIDSCHAQVILPDQWQPAVGFAPWVEEVWANYLSNACKYGGPMPRIELGSSLDENGQARFWVKDNGIGLSAEELPQLFMPFVRLEPDQIQGNGLGLSIVRRLVERLGGAVGVHSAGLGQGSLFYFTLPTFNSA